MKSVSNGEPLCFRLTRRYRPVNRWPACREPRGAFALCAPAAKGYIARAPVSDSLPADTESTPRAPLRPAGQGLSDSLPQRIVPVN